MSGWRILAERRIEEAMAAGAFEDLPGEGKPLRLEAYPHADSAWRLAFHILDSAGFRPRWVELTIEVRGRLRQARARFEADLSREGAQEMARRRFTEGLVKVNALIDELNLLAPRDHFRRPRLSIEREITSVENAVFGESRLKEAATAPRP